MSLWYPCVYCTEDLKCTKYSDDEVTSYCLLGTCHDETKSNADRIRAMSDEELASALYAGCSGRECPEGMWDNPLTEDEEDSLCFCGSTASIGVDADCYGYLGSIGVFCDNPYCGGAYLGESMELSGDYAEWIASFPAEDVKYVVDGWNRRGSNVARALYENFKGAKNEP